MRWRRRSTTDISILRNGTLLGTGGVTSSGGYQFAASNLTLAAGDTLRFVIGTGGNGHGWDSTFVSAQITALAVPEPSTRALLVAGAGLAALCRFRRRRF